MHGHTYVPVLQAGKYAWVETWSEEHSRPYYYDQANHISTWDKPADLAWRRVYLPDDPDSSAQPETAADSSAQPETAADSSAQPETAADSTLA